MDYHRFNIGKPEAGDMNAWWAENIERGVITTGFLGDPGDDGERHLKAPAKWDWVLAYVSGKGFVGAGKIRGVETYRLHPAPPDGTLSDHQHERAVVWKYVIRDVNDAIRYDEAEVLFPVGTRQRTTNREASKELVKRLRQKGENLRSGEIQYWWVLDAVKDLGQPSTLKEIEAWLEAKQPRDDHSDLIDNACILSVNDANRFHHDKGRKSFRTNQGNPKDALYRNGIRTDVTYELYDREKHGVWDVVANADGRPEAVRIEDGEADKALSEARRQVASEPRPPSTQSMMPACGKCAQWRCAKARASFDRVCSMPTIEDARSRAAPWSKFWKPHISCPIAAITLTARTTACCSGQISTRCSTKACCGSTAMASCRSTNDWLIAVTMQGYAGRNSACPPIQPASHTKIIWHTIA